MPGSIRMMTAEIFPKPGARNGPCEGNCSHVECCIMRLEAACTCTHCARPIGYDSAFYRGIFAHVHCFEQAMSRMAGNEGWAIPVPEEMRATA